MNDTTLDGPGHPVARVDGPLKVTGRAVYTVDHHFPGMVFAVPVGATIAAGRLLRVHTAQAQAMPGVLAVYTRENIGPLYRVSKTSGVMIDERRPPLSDDDIGYYGQYIALVVAETFEQARAAASAVHADYDARDPDVSDVRESEQPMQTQSERGDAPAAFAAAEVTLDETYATPVETHNPIELHATVARFEDGGFTLYETSQAIVNHKAAMAQMLGVAPEAVRVITRFLGSGFGGKLWPWPHCVLAAAAARHLGRPVKLEVSRKTMFETVGHRNSTRQRMRLSATPQGRLTSLRQDYVIQASRLDLHHEDCGEATAYLYSTPNLAIRWGYARRDMGAATSMRGPGAVPGMFAVESAMNEMAQRLGMDPVAFRLLNEPEQDESRGVPFSSRHLKECLKTGAERFGWIDRTPAVGSMRRDGVVLGWGMASASWMAKRLPATVSVSLLADGRARVACATQDLGTGTYTVLGQMVSRVLRLPLARIDVVIGDTALPPGPTSGGSMATGSLVPAASDAARQARDRLLATAVEAPHGPFAGEDAATLTFDNGRVRRSGAHDDDGVPLTEVLAAAGLSQIGGEGRSRASDKDEGADEHSIQSFGAHFVEVGWQPEIARLRVQRVLSVMDAGRIINPQAGRNQIEGAVIMGLGMALLEETHYDARCGAPINGSLADYLVAVHADAPETDVVFLDYPDYALNEVGARGIGEIGLAGVAAAITDAVHHATGVRVRELPVRIEDLLLAEVT